jgi:hypothetical protein
MNFLIEMNYEGHQHIKRAEANGFTGQNSQQGEGPHF